MGLNLLNSSNDPICPTFAAGSFSLVSNAKSIFSNLNDSAAPGVANGYANTIIGLTVGSFNSDWNNNVLTQSIQPAYSNGLLSFGNTGLQS